MYEDNCKVLASVCRNVFEQMTNTAVDSVSVKRDQRPDTHYAFASTIKYEHLEQQLEGNFTLGFTDTEMASAVAASMAETMGMDVQEGLGNQAIDVLNEFMNTVIGRTVAKWDDMGFSTKFGVPNASTNVSLKPIAEIDTESYIIILSLSVHHIVFRLSFSDIKLSALAGKKILVADDSLVVRTVITKHFKALGFEVEHAKNGIHAIEKSTQFKPDLTIMDQVMPEMNGLDAILEIKQRRRNAKFIMLTSTSRKDEMVTAKTLGVCKYLIKPIQIKELIQAVSQVLID
jgi:response regulator NasT